MGVGFGCFWEVIAVSGLFRLDLGEFEWVWLGERSRSAPLKMYL